MGLLDDNVMEAALARIAKTDELVAELHVKSLQAEARAEAVKDAIFLLLTGSVEERKAQARQSLEYGQAMDEYYAALQAYEALRNERTRKFAVIECWRSWSSARTKGIIT